MAFSFVQSKSFSVVGPGDPKSTTVTMDATIPSGSLIVATCSLSNTTQTMTPSDSNSSTYYESGSYNTGSYLIKQFYAVTTGNVTQCTMTRGGTGTGALRFSFAEYRGQAASSIVVDSDTGTGTGTTASTTAVTPSAGDLTVGCCYANTSATSMTPADANYGTYYQALGYFVTVYRLTSTTSETSPLTLATSQTWHELAVVYKVSPTSIGTVMGLAKSSVKSVNGLAIASVKSINGLT